MIVKAILERYNEIIMEKDEKGESRFGLNFLGATQIP